MHLATSSEGTRLDDQSNYEYPLENSDLSPAPQGYVQAIRHGARRGLKWTTFIVGPLAALFLVIGLGVTVLHFVRGRGASFLRSDDALALILGPVGFYLSSCLWGMIAGVICALLARNRRGRESDRFQFTVRGMLAFTAIVALYLWIIVALWNA